MAFEPGNKIGALANHRTPKLFRDALMVAIKRANAEGVEAIQVLADGLVAKAIADRDVQAIQMIADRIDGKVPQGHGGTEDLPAIHTRTEVVYTIVDPAPSDTADTDSGSPGIPTIIKTGEV